MRAAVVAVEHRAAEGVVARRVCGHALHPERNQNRFFIDLNYLKIDIGHE